VYVYTNVIVALFRNGEFKASGAVNKILSAIAKRTKAEEIFSAGGSNQTAITRERFDRFRCGFLHCYGNEHRIEWVL
jgi:hypothetical protein